MTKRGNGEGSKPRKRPDGRWEARYTLHTATGAKRRTVYGKTRQETAEKLTRALADRDGGLVYDDEGITVGEYLDRWLKDSVKGTVRPSTFECYEIIVEGHIKPVIGRRKLKDLKPEHVAALYRDRLDAGLSPASVNKIHVILHKALKLAMRWGKVGRNVTEAVTPPKPQPEEIRPLDGMQVAALLRAAGETEDRREDRLEALYVAAVTTGMRQGELLALRWEDVSLDLGVASVRHTITRSGTAYSLGKPKTAKGRRTVKLSKRTVAALKRHKARQDLERGIANKTGTYQDRGLVFATKTGGITNPSNVRRSFARMLKRAVLPEKTRFHDLRHTCATTLLRAGKHPKLVQELLGHANVSITLDTYSHVLPGMSDGLADAIDDAIDEATDQAPTLTKLPEEAV